MPYKTWVVSFLALLIPLKGGAEERLVSLKPNITEIVFDLGKGEALVGVTSYCDRPVQAQTITKVADYIHADTEKIMSLRPSLVLASEENSVEREIRFLEKQGIKVALLPFARLNDMLGSIGEIGRLLGVSNRAEAVIKSFHEEMARLALRVPSHLATQKIIVIVGMKPLVVVGAHNLLDDTLQALHLGNVYRGSKNHYPTINLEDLILKAPDIIIDLSMGNEERTKKDHWDLLKNLTSIPAVRNKRYYVLNIRDFRPSPSLLDGVKKMVELFSVIGDASQP